MASILFSLVLTSCAWATEPPAPHPERHDGEVAMLVAGLLDHQHYEDLDVDDEIANRWLDGYLRTLDFNRMIFLEEDIALFQEDVDTLDDNVSTSMRIAFDIHAVYRNRIEERVAAALEVLDQPVDLSDDETWQYDREDAEWPQTAEDADELWRKRIEDEFIRGALMERAEDKTKEILVKRYNRLRKDSRRTEGADIREWWLTSLARSFDPHSAYFKPASKDDFDIEISNSVTGIGASLQTQGEYTVVMNVITGGPADRDGTLQKDDKIVAVAQDGEEPVDIVDLRIDKVVKLIRGEKGTEVTLTVIPVDADNPGETRQIPLIRDKVTLTASAATSEVHEIDGQKLGVIELPSFYMDGKRGAADDVRDLLKELEDQQVDGVALDLRANGGGSLDEAIKLAGLFLPAGPIVQVRDPRGRVQVLRDPDSQTVYDGPLIVLTSPRSASASEIVAGAIQDYGRGVVVGSEQTHGKGTVQSVIGLMQLLQRMSNRDLPNEDVAGALKLTIQKFYRVSGGSTQNRGVRADVVVPSQWDGLDIYEGDLDNALPYDEIAPARFRSWGDLDGKVAQLRSKSKQRVAGSDDFGELAEAIDRREAQQASGIVSLQLDARKAELDALDPRDEKPEEGEEDEQEKTNDFVLDEALHILHDYVVLKG